MHDARYSVEVKVTGGRVDKDRKGDAVRKSAKHKANTKRSMYVHLRGVHQAASEETEVIRGTHVEPLRPTERSAV